MKKCRVQLSLFVAFSLLFSNCHSGAQVIGSKARRPLNIILMIGDGMGLAQISAAAALNGGLSLDLFTCIGMVKTSSSDDYITDSAAGATAYSTGQKTYNGAIGLGPDSAALSTILEMAEKNGLSTGLVSTCSVTHATPASFYAHRASREMHKEIASDFYGKGIDFVAASGKPFFDLQRLASEGYAVHTGLSSPAEQTGKQFWFCNDSTDAPKAAERGDWLQRATEAALAGLQSNRKGFFLMVEGSQIDWGGHDNDFDYMVSELLDFDRAVKAALDFAAREGNTLVIVTADHETGGLSLNGEKHNGKPLGHHFSSTHHSGIMVPLYAYGPGAVSFTGTFENTEVFRKMKSLYGF